MPVITIFSASHCRADEVADKVAQKLGYKLIGEEILDWTSQEFDMSREKLVRAMHGASSVLDKFAREKEKCVAYLRVAIAEHVKDDNIVYHGFAGHLLPREITHILKVCLVANRDYRIDQATRSEGVSKRGASKSIKKDDEERKKWTQHLFDAGPWDKSLYDIKIPMHETSVEDVVDLICENARKDPVKTTPASAKAVNDTVFAARVNIALVEQGHDVLVTSDEGNISIFIKKYVMRLEHLKKELKKIADGVPGVKSTEIHLGPGFQRPAIYPGLEFEMPSKVLLVDDETEFVQTLSERLQMRDLDTAVVFNGEEALSYMQEEEPEVMVLDLRMPGIDGVEVLRRVKKKHPNVEVIILTGHGTEKDEALTRELGAFAYLEKPVEIDKLAKTVREAYEKLRRDKAQRQQNTD